MPGCLVWVRTSGFWRTITTWRYLCLLYFGNNGYARNCFVGFAGILPAKLPKLRMAYNEDAFWNNCMIFILQSVTTWMNTSVLIRCVKHSLLSQPAFFFYTRSVWSLYSSWTICWNEILYRTHIRCWFGRYSYCLKRVVCRHIRCAYPVCSFSEFYQFCSWRNGRRRQET